jgi:hypothetical protein
MARAASEALRPNGPPPLDSAQWAADYNSRDRGRRLPRVEHVTQSPRSARGGVATWPAARRK